MATGRPVVRGTRISVELVVDLLSIRADRKRSPVSEGEASGSTGRVAPIAAACTLVGLDWQNKTVGTDLLAHGDANSRVRTHAGRQVQVDLVQARESRRYAGVQNI